MLPIHMAYWPQCIYNLGIIFTGDVADSGPDTELPATLCPTTGNVSFIEMRVYLNFHYNPYLFQWGFSVSRPITILILGAPA